MTPPPKRIAVAGFQHETNTLAPSRAGLAEFRMADSWPPLLQGTEVIPGTLGMNLPIAGAIATAQAQGIDLAPILWAAAEPSGFVTDVAFDTITDMILAGLDQSPPVDALYLDLHGAMVTQSHPDGEAELLRRIRTRFGDRPIALSLDLHANISAPLVARADYITIYRSYPHLDMAQTGARAMQGLITPPPGPPRPRCAAFRQAPFLIPLHAQFTGAPPCQGLYAGLDDLCAPGENVDIALGFTAADIADCGPSVVAYAQDQSRADTLADQVLAQLLAAEPHLDTQLLTPAQAVRTAQTLTQNGPVILADVQDNAGAGGSSDTTGLLQALVSEGADRALLGVIADADIAAQAHAAGVGAVIQGPLGGRSGAVGDAPFDGAFEVLALSDGAIPYTGAMYGGGVAQIGPSCLVRLAQIPGDIRVVISSLRTQCLDRAFFTHFGQEPLDAALVCVKSTVHFRADFEPGAAAVLNVAAPGLFPCRLTDIAYANLRPGIRRPR